MMIDTGTLVWLHAVHGVDPMTMPEFTQWEVDIRQISKNLIDEQNQDATYYFHETGLSNPSIQKYNRCSVCQYTG